MIKSHLEVVEQALELLAELDNDSLTEIAAPYFTASIGQHLRHVVDHYDNLLNGFGQGHVNYNIRQRFSSIESSIDDCRHTFLSITNKLKSLTLEQLEFPLSVLTEISVCETTDAIVNSNLNRELVFVSSHAIHHYALIKIMRQMQGQSVPDNFGYAPATLSFMRQQAG